MGQLSHILGRRRVSVLRRSPSFESSRAIPREDIRTRARDSGAGSFGHVFHRGASRNQASAAIGGRSTRGAESAGFSAE